MLIMVLKFSSKASYTQDDAGKWGGDLIEGGLCFVGISSSKGEVNIALLAWFGMGT